MAGEVRQAVPPPQGELKHRTYLTGAGKPLGEELLEGDAEQALHGEPPPAPLQPPAPIAAFVCHGQTLVPVKQREKNTCPLKIHHLTVLGKH